MLATIDAAKHHLSLWAAAVISLPPFACTSLLFDHNKHCNDSDALRVKSHILTS